MRKFTPIHLRVCLLHWDGKTNTEIAQMLNRSDAWVSTILNSPEAVDVFKRLQNRALDTTSDIQAILQAAAPLALQEKIRVMHHGSNDSVRNKAAQELLELAGHVATRQIEIRRPDHVEEEFRDKSEADIRRSILESIEGPQDPTDDKTTVPLLH